MTDDQFDKILAQLEIISLQLTVLVGQTLKRAPLTDEELVECQTSVVETARQLEEVHRQERSFR